MSEKHKVTGGGDAEDRPDEAAPCDDQIVEINVESLLVVTTNPPPPTPPKDGIDDGRRGGDLSYSAEILRLSGKEDGDPPKRPRKKGR